MMICSRRLYKGNAYDICLPIADSGVTLVRFYTRGDVIVEKEPEISGDSMCFSFTEEDLASLEDGVLRYQVVTDYETTDTNSPYVVVTPGDYSGSTLEDLLEDAYNSGYTAGYESGYTDGQEECRDYSKEYFTIEALEDGELAIHYPCNYSINDGEWAAITGDTTISLNDGDKVRFKRGSGGDYVTGMLSNNTITFSAYGNVMSLLYDDFTWRTEIISTFFFRRLFLNCTNLVYVENLVLPATTLSQGCYNELFKGCTSITTAPALPAATLAELCYSDMFSECTSLAQAPALPATTLANSCYLRMFQGCTRLTIAQELPATELVNACYAEMFRECTSLTQAPVLPATTLAGACYAGMFRGCTSLNYVKCLATDISAEACIQLFLYMVSSTGTFVKAAGVSWPTGDSGIPTGWTVIEA